ncbi:hypothetical protein JHK82_027416 [Glycine max]|nr:hypothetical protein JHK82_027416 [Glycine max]
MITHENIVATIVVVMTIIPNVGSKDVYMAYLPPAHVFEMATEVFNRILTNLGRTALPVPGFCMQKGGICGDGPDSDDCHDGRHKCLYIVNSFSHASPSPLSFSSPHYLSCLHSLPFRLSPPQHTATSLHSVVDVFHHRHILPERRFSVNESANEYTDDEDVSWKVQRVAAKCLVALIVSRPKILSKLYDEPLKCKVSHGYERLKPHCWELGRPNSCGMTPSLPKIFLPSPPEALLVLLDGSIVSCIASNEVEKVVAHIRELKVPSAIVTALRPSIEPFNIEPYRQPCNLRLNPSPFSFDCYEPYLLFQFQALKPIDIEHLPLNLIDKEALHIEVNEVQSSRLELAVREEQH